MNEPVAIGIDLGTTYSVIAQLDEGGRSAIVRNREGDLLTPSVVLFYDDEIVVGKAAKKAAGVAMDRVAECVKRDIGTPFYSRRIKGQQIPPEAIQACVLRKLKEDAAAVVGPNFKAVITVPAYFDEPRRKATADAGEIAGVDVLDIVNEPTAAALAFGEQLGYLTAKGDPKQPMKVLVYDLGGGTFDITIIDLAPGNIRTMATDGDVELGGRDWDKLLAGHVAKMFQEQTGINIQSDPAAMDRLMQQVEDAKHTLSSRDRAIVPVDHQGMSVEISVSRSEFESMSQALLERTAFTTRQVLAAAGLNWPDISRILLVGGSTRMPMVPTMIQGLSGIAPDRSINPDEAVARGAALFAAYQISKQGGPRQTTFQVTDVCAHSLGVQGIDQGTLRRENVIVIPRNTPLPARVMKPFVTQTAAQRSIVVQVLEGESSRPEMCSRIGRSVLRNLPANLPKGQQVNISFAYGTNARLDVSAEIPGTDHRVGIELEREHGLSNALLGRWRQLIAENDATSVDELLAEALGIHSTAAAGAAADATRQTPTTPDVAAAPHGGFAATASLAAADSGVRSGIPSAAGGTTTLGNSTAAQAGISSSTTDRLDIQRRQRLTRRIIFVCGHVVSAILGLAAGYYILCWLRPEADFLGLFSR